MWLEKEKWALTKQTFVHNRFSKTRMPIQPDFILMNMNGIPDLSFQSSSESQMKCQWSLLASASGSRLNLNTPHWPKQTLALCLKLVFLSPPCQSHPRRRRSSGVDKATGCSLLRLNYQFYFSEHILTFSTICICRYVLYNVAGCRKYTKETW